MYGMGESVTTRSLPYFVRDGRIELPISVWKTDVIPFN